MARYEKVIVELILLLVAFMALMVFAPDIIPLLETAQDNTSAQPVAAFFLFLKLIMEIFTRIVYTILAYLVVGGIVILNGRRD
mgnify:FL=1